MSGLSRRLHECELVVTLHRRVIFRLIFWGHDLVYGRLNALGERDALGVRFETRSELAIEKRHGSAMESLIGQPCALTAYDGANLFPSLTVDDWMRHVTHAGASIDARNLDVHLPSLHELSR